MTLNFIAEKTNKQMLTTSLQLSQVETPDGHYLLIPLGLRWLAWVGRILVLSCN